MDAFLNSLVEGISKASDIMWDDVLWILLMIVGSIYSIYLGFPQIRYFKRAFKETFGSVFGDKEKDKAGTMSSFQALATAIAAQVGTGNIAGIATAIMAGGPGAIFWMWISGIIGMATIFGEAVLAQKYREVRDGDYVGGPAFYISKGLKYKPLAKFLAGFFSVAIILALGFIGNLVQSNSISAAVTEATGINPIFIGVGIAIAAALVFMGGMKRIANFAEMVVPFMAALYIVGVIVVMFKFGDQVVPAFKSIFVEAFKPTSVMGGAIGVTVKQAIRFGVARGLFSNEAGMGSTPHAHAVANVKHPAEQGLVAIVGVFVDTLVVGTATAMVILVTGAHEKGLAGPLVTQDAFSTAFGTYGTIFLAICLTFFAFTTIVGWYYFGETNIRYLFGKKGLLPYRILVVLFIVLGSSLTQKVDFVWKMADFFNGLMVFPNMIALLFLASQVKRILDSYKAGQEFIREEIG
ncbi:alanine/glycine:cation symporter family protein [Facklamia miroungae]|uniref:Alanine or glycine:cation symporter, AGCS family n=1 Tax=Facklamia miroungae TaxID=120956 RepID=A0A1G7Q8X5_9LACT|nr:sodium:alanine symporter family protein [Facklamia miroungae]NKZ28863.1 alanine:cation symporter family protein [Facklamia miroungae]SDF94972.1 alanine or glycine:cation symporter, AGCS family [Facklamia miroungae]